MRGGLVDLVTGAPAGRRLTRSFRPAEATSLDRTIHGMAVAVGGCPPTGVAVADTADRAETLTVHGSTLRFGRSDAVAIAEARYGAGLGRSGLIVTVLFDRGQIELRLVQDGRLVDAAALTAELDGAASTRSATTPDRPVATLTEWGQRAHQYLTRVERLLHPALFIVDTSRASNVIVDTSRATSVLGLWLHLFRARTPQVMANLGRESAIVGAAALAADAAGEPIG